MPYFARINKSTKIVEEVISATQLQIYGLDNFEDWVQTSYNASIRKNYAGIGDKYDATKDAFIPPKPYNSWTLDSSTCQWVPPSANPSTATTFYNWDESSTSWKKVSGHVT